MQASHGPISKCPRRKDTSKTRSLPVLEDFSSSSLHPDTSTASIAQTKPRSSPRLHLAETQKI